MGDKPDEGRGAGMGDRRRRLTWGGEGWMTIAAIVVVLLCLLFVAQTSGAAAATGDPSPVAAAAVVSPDRSSPKPDLSKGALYGRVVDVQTGKPVPGATVALRDKSGKTVAWTTTDADGRYGLTADTLKVLQLQPVRRKGVLARVASTVGGIVSAPVRFVGGALKMSPSDAARTAFAAVTGGPAGLAGAVASRVQRAAMGRVSDAAVKNVMSQRAIDRTERGALLPGEVQVLVSAAGYHEVRGRAGAYWLDVARRAEDGGAVGACAHLEPVALAPEGWDRPGGVQDTAVLLSDIQADRTLVPAGDSVRLSVKLDAPDTEKSAAGVRVFARENAKGTLCELTLQADGRFAGELPVPAEIGSRDISVTFAAVRSIPVAMDLTNDEGKDPLAALVAGLDELRPDKPWDYDPRLFAAENRLEIRLTVLGAAEKRLTTTLAHTAR